MGTRNKGLNKYNTTENGCHDCDIDIAKAVLCRKTVKWKGTLSFFCLLAEKNKENN